MQKTNNLLNFVTKQEILDNIKTSIMKIYYDDPAIHTDGFLKKLTTKTLEIIEQVDDLYLEIVEDSKILNVANQYETSKDTIAKDIIELILYTTIARQHILIDELGSE